MFTKLKIGINIFFKKGVFKGEARCCQGGGGTLLPRGGTKALPPYTNALVRPCTYELNQICNVYIFANRCSRA